jgi:hypothetical protein
MARNPDESWTIGIVNMTGCLSDPLDSVKNHPAKMFWYYGAATYDVTVRAEELVTEPEVKFAVMRSSSAGKMAVEDSVAMHDGEVTVTVGPKELVTLRGAKGAGTVVDARKQQTRAPRLSSAPYAEGRNLVIPLRVAGEHRISVCDMAGRSVIFLQKVVSAGHDEYRIPMNGQGAGVYAVRVAQPGRVAQTRTVLVR